jgi:hypothetical protein
MALGSGLAKMQQHATGQQGKMSIHRSATSKSHLAGDSPQKQSEHEKPYNWPPVRKRKRDMGTDTAYAENTGVMVSEILPPVLFCF